VELQYFKAKSCSPVHSIPNNFPDRQHAVFVCKQMCCVARRAEAPPKASLANKNLLVVIILGFPHRYSLDRIPRKFMAYSRTQAHPTEPFDREAKCMFSSLRRRLTVWAQWHRNVQTASISRLPLRSRLRRTLSWLC
jgi:hypothetical protein